MTYNFFYDEKIADSITEYGKQVLRIMTGKTEPCVGDTVSWIDAKGNVLSESAKIYSINDDIIEIGIDELDETFFVRKEDIR